jgi:hypothetical protein
MYLRSFGQWYRLFWIGFLQSRLFYIIGILLQSLGELSHCLKFPPKEYRSKYRDNSIQLKRNDNGDSIHVDDKTQLKRQFGCDELFRNSKYYAEFRLPFIKHTQLTKERSFDVERKTHERFIILMQTSGNSGIAFFIAAFCLFVGIIQQFSLLLLGIAICFFVGSIILIWNFRNQRQRLLDWEFEVNRKYDP